MDQQLNSVWGQEKCGSDSQDPIQETAWVHASQRGDTLAFNRLVLKWEKTVYNIALRILQDRDDAAEATQEIFLLAFKNIRRFRQDSKFSTWLYRIAVNQCVSRSRRRPQGIQISLDAEAGAVCDQLHTSETQDCELLRTENRARVRTALSFLSPEQRAVIELKFYQDLTFDDIGSVLQVPVSTIKSRLYSGLEMLKVRLGRRA